MAEALEFHQLANLFPLIEGQVFDDLVADIAANGIREPIVLHEGKILDGRNRYRAGVAAGVLDRRGFSNTREAPVSRLFIPREDGDALAFVLSRNLHRRHLTTSQRALVAARIALLARGRPGEAASPSAQQAAAVLRVGTRSIERARELLRNGTAELLAEVDGGRLTISAAARLAGLSASTQVALVESGCSLVAAARRSRAHAGLSARGEYAPLWKLVDAICDGLENGRLDLADMAARDLSRALVKAARAGS